MAHGSQRSVVAFEPISSIYAFLLFTQMSQTAFRSALVAHLRNLDSKDDDFETLLQKAADLYRVHVDPGADNGKFFRLAIERARAIHKEDEDALAVLDSKSALLLAEFPGGDLIFNHIFDAPNHPECKYGVKGQALLGRVNYLRYCFPVAWDMRNRTALKSVFAEEQKDAHNRLVVATRNDKNKAAIAGLRSGLNRVAAATAAALKKQADGKAETKDEDAENDAERMLMELDNGVCFDCPCVNNFCNYLRPLGLSDIFIIVYFGSINTACRNLTASHQLVSLTEENRAMLKPFGIATPQELCKPFDLCRSRVVCRRPRLSDEEGQRTYNQFMRESRTILSTKASKDVKTQRQLDLLIRLALVDIADTQHMPANGQFDLTEEIITFLYGRKSLMMNLFIIATKYSDLLGDQDWCELASRINDWSSLDRMAVIRECAEDVS